MTRMEFFKSEEMKKVQDNISTCAIIGRVFAIGSSVMSFMKSHDYSIIFTMLFFVTMFLLIYFLQSRVAAILLSLFSALSTAVMFMQTGKPGGILFVLFGIYGIIYTFKFQNAWNEYKKNAVVDSNTDE